MNLLGGVYASTNSLAAAAPPYYNPRRDGSASMTVQNEWTQFRRYDRSLTHRLDMEFGRYWQAGHDSGRIQSLRYVIAWAPDDRSELRLALGYLRRPYDGVQTSQKDISLLMNLRF
jgi:biofilm PGA synthesis protein PgaA